jgi:hypothetical protein
MLAASLFFPSRAELLAHREKLEIGARAAAPTP